MSIDKKILTVAVVGAAVVAGAVALSMQKPAEPPMTTSEKGKEQCFGVAKAAENGCAAANGNHSCGGLSKVDNSGQDWVLVEAGTCVQMGGKLEAFDDAPAPAAAPAEAPAAAPEGDAKSGG
jgi:uncharacterized membrane protein